MKIAPTALAIALTLSGTSFSQAGDVDHIEWYGMAHEIKSPRDAAAAPNQNNNHLKQQRRSRSAVSDQHDKKRPPMTIFTWGEKF